MMSNFSKLIDEEDLFKEEGNAGREDNFHVTVKYGLTTDELKEIKDRLDTEKGGKFHMGSSSIFEGEEYDVVKVSIESKDFARLHEKLNELPHEDKHPDYHAHATIAYVKSGKGKKYVGKFKIDKEFKFKEVYFGDRDRKNHKIKLSENFAWYKEAQVAQPVMQRKSIEQIATEVRARIVSDEEDDVLQAQCFRISKILREALLTNGYDAVLVKGTFYVERPEDRQDDPDALHSLDKPDEAMQEREELDENNEVLHYWVEVAGIIADITATQFNDEIDGEVMEPVTVGSYAEFPRYTAENRGHHGPAIAKNNNWYRTAEQRGIPEFAKIVRDWAVKNFGAGEGLKEHCNRVSTELAKFLNRKGYPSAVVIFGAYTVDNPDPEACQHMDEAMYFSKEDMEEGKKHPEHYWVEVEGNVVDITADQFNKELNQPAPPITIGTYASLPRYIRGIEQEL